MSTEVPRSNGTGEPIPSQASKGGFSRFLRRLFAEPPELVSVQPIPRVVQLPPHMEGFADKIQQGIAGQIVVDEQRKLEWQKGVDKLRTEEAEKQAQAGAEQRERAQQLRIKTERATTEGAEVLGKFQIAEKLEVIRQTVWEGRGEIVPFRPYFDFPHYGEWDRIRDKIWRGEISYRKQPPKPKYDLLGGVELVFEYPDVVWVKTEVNSDSTIQTFSYSSSQGTEPSPFAARTSLNVHVLNIHEDSKEDKKVLEISAVAPFLRGGQMIDVTIPIDAKDGETLLEEALIKDSAYRTARGFIPSILEEEGKNRVESFKMGTGKTKGRR